MGIFCGRRPAYPGNALMAIENLPKSVADPCCGNGAILDILRDEGGHIVFGADIHNYGWPHMVRRDYLAEPVMTNGTAIVSNPPYQLALEFFDWREAAGN
jgi:hypothetical protein